MIRTQLASTARPMCIVHKDRQAVAIRVTETLKPVPQLVRRKQCAECAAKPVAKRQGVNERILKL